MKKFALYMLMAVALVGVVSCNDSDAEIVTTSASSTAVTAFSLAEDDDVLENLDSVYFSIDLVNALIYNADSLPYGTDVRKLILNITTDGCSACDLIIPRKNQSDTTISYLENSTDSINFSNGPVKLHIVSLDLQESRDYTITVNVHQMKPDSLYWNRVARRQLPSMFIPAQQKTVEYKGQAFCLTSGQSKYCLAVTDNPANDDWKKQLIEFDFYPQILSLTATEDALYMLDVDGNLYTSSEGTQWTSCNVAWSHIYGGYRSSLLGVVNKDGVYYHVTYPSTIETPIEENFPISGTSQMLVFESKWSDLPQAIIVGGKCRDGRIVGDTWAFDGDTWACINKGDLPARQNMTIVPYFSFKTSASTWRAKQHSTLFAMFGEAEDGSLSKGVYVSLDQGLHWSLADDLLQLPDYIPARKNAQALVYSSILSRASASTCWEEFESKKLPNWLFVNDDVMSRVTAEINEWECPYIYLFGGVGESGGTYNTVWRGVVNRLSFRPIY